ncbi:uncharacterized protein LOC130667593 isoform X2 [Microplitis mediator]|uniref:uncharacterized protein LOC130667593 isoform X2 n=1 Tax=Microplitis mediator TaxID=375433 RepID=UPI00255718C1|nr:uncharacterized protein LOC130667593 isoform X2 [Microplitis mediator]
MILLESLEYNCPGIFESSDEPKSDEKIQEPEIQKSINTNNERNIGGHKRAKNKKRREAQQEFTHSWVVGTLKGHTGPVLDINFSSDDKFLASCAEDCSLLPKDTLKDNADEVINSSRKSSPSVIHCGKKTSKKTGKKDTTTSRKKNSSRVNKPAMIRSCSSGGSSIRSSNSNSISSNSSSSSMESVSSINDQTVLSRRQKKNRRASGDPDLVVYNRNLHHNVNCLNLPLHHYPIQYTPRFVDDFPPLIMSPYEIQNQELIHQTIPNHINNSFYGTTTANRLNFIPLSKPVSNTYAKTYQIVGNSMNTVQYCKYFECLKYMSHSTLIFKLKTLTHPTHYLQCLGYLYKNDLKSTGVSFLYTPHQELIQYFYGHAEEEREKFYYRRRKCLNVNAKIFIPNSLNHKPKSATGISNSVESSDLESECSSDSEKSESSASYLLYSDGKVDPMLLILSYLDAVDRNRKNTAERECVRCSKKFSIDLSTGEYNSKEKCRYHCNSEMDLSPINNSKVRKCCRKPRDSKGCIEADFHIWSGVEPGVNGPFHGYMTTQPLKSSGSNRRMFDVVALDCEMCITSNGFEPTRLTVVQLDGSTIYDAFIKPDHEIIDYNTQFSGIRAEDLQGARTLHDVHRDLQTFIHADTIIIGHGLENDLRKLKILHETVLDTAFIYPHRYGFPNKTKLKILAETELHRTIQSAEHCAHEDAQAAMDLALNKVLEDVGKRK